MKKDNESWDHWNDDVVAQNSNINFIVGGCEMLRVAEDGFYVRGVKVTQDDKEAEIVYNAFKQLLTWAELNRI